MPDELTVDVRIEKLRNRGDAHGSYDWPQGDPDYVAEYSLTAEEIPALIALATKWVDEPPEKAVVYAPVHAWRALGQLRAVEAVQPLLDVQDELSRIGDDWYLEEFPHVFGLVGQPAIQPLAAYLADESRREFPRSAAASGLREIARHYPEWRAEVVTILTAELGRHRSDCGVLNGLLVADLLDLGAVESAEAIERAFAADIIDPTVAGDWEDVRAELGVPGLGLAPDRSPTWPTLREQFGLSGPSAAFRDRFGLESGSEATRAPAADRRSRSDAKRQARAKRKAERKNRKRHRKPR